MESFVNLTILGTDKPVLSSQYWEVQTVAALHRWLYNRGQMYISKMPVWECGNGCLIEVGCQIEVITNTGSNVCMCTL